MPIKQVGSEIVESPPFLEPAHRLTLKKVFPNFLARIAEHKPETLVFLDRKGRALAWLADALWEQLGLGKKPAIRFISPPKNHWGEVKEDAEYHIKLAAWATKRGLAGKKLAVVDDVCTRTGASMWNVKRGLEKAGAKVVTAAIEDYAGNCDISQGKSPGFKVMQPRISRSAGDIHAGKSDARALRLQRNEMRALGAEILREHEARQEEP